MGRSRKPGKRTKSGKLSQSVEEKAKRGLERNIQGVALSQPHRRNLPKDMRKDQKAECELGRLFLAKLITEPQYEAGCKFRRLIADFRQVIAAPITRVSAANLMVSESGMEAPEASRLENETAETEEERRDRVVGAFNRTQTRLTHVHEAKAVWAELDRVAVMDAPMFDIWHLREGLDCLVKFWRLAHDGTSVIRVSISTAPWLDTVDA